MKEHFSENYIKQLKEKFDELEKVRDTIINTSIKLNRLSKQIIYSVIKGNLKRAKELLEELEKYRKELDELTKDKPMYYNNYSIAYREYVEAKIFYEYIISDKIPTHDELKVNEFQYIEGLVDVVGELFRKGVEEGTKGNFEFLERVKRTIEEIYSFLLELEFKNYEYRRKVDYVVNILNKIQEILFYRKIKE